MKSLLKQPNFILGVISIVLLFVGIGCIANSYPAGDYIIGASVVIGAIHWVWAIAEVSKTDSLRSSQKKFWLILVIIVPAFGSMFYYLMHSRTNQIV